MESLFVRSLALESVTADAQTLTSASRTTADTTFAVADGREGVIRVYAASCSALLHEFASIHNRVYTLHYTSFSDSLVTLESDGTGVGDRSPAGNNKYSDETTKATATENDDDAETFLCVYHDWRERQMVRGYTLPLGVLEKPSSNQKADCVAVCSFTGRVVVAMGTRLNIWQCSHHFFEHVMELQVDMTQRHAFMQLEYVAIHGVYVAYASQTEVRVMEIHVRSSNDSSLPLDTATAVAAVDKTTVLENYSRKPNDRDSVPEDAAHCMEITSFEDLDAIVQVPVSCSAYSTMEADTKQDKLNERRLFDEHEQIPMVLGRNEAQQEMWHLAGLVKAQDIRANQAMSYYISENDVRVLLRRYLPPNHSLQSLKFLPETIDNRMCVETRSYTRLLIATEKNAFIYYFLSEKVDLTRKKMSKKVLGMTERSKSRGMHTPIQVGDIADKQRRDSFASVQKDGDEDQDETDNSMESGRVVMHYSFTSVVTSITANSSFLFVATLSGLQVWSIWSPCHYIAASRALSRSLVPQPSQPQLLCTQPIPYPVSQLAVLDSYVVLLPQTNSLERHGSKDILQLASLAASERLPEAEFELRPPLDVSRNPCQRSIVIFEQSPPSLIFSYVRQGVQSVNGNLRPFQIDLLLSLFSLYRYRADVGFDLLRLALSNDAFREDNIASMSGRKERLALKLETELYDRLAKGCAADLAAVFMSEHHRNLDRAALLFVASNVPSIEVMHRLEAIVGTVDRSEVIQATGKYLDVFVYPPPKSLADICSHKPARGTNSADAEFTRIVLSHYGRYFPEQLSRLVVDSSLEWTLKDIAFALKQLGESSSHGARVKIARLVLVLRATAFHADDWDVFRTSEGSSAEDFSTKCSYTSMLALVDDLLQNHVDELVHLAVTHPDLLVQEITTAESEKRASCRHLSSSNLTKALLEDAPLKYLDILEHIFNSAIGGQETIQSTLRFCLSAIGEAAATSLTKIASSTSSSSSSLDEEPPSATPFVPDQALVLRFLVFVLQMFPALEQLSEKEEVQDDEEDLHNAKTSVATELTRLCVKLSSLFHGSVNSDEGGHVESMLCDLFESVMMEAASHGHLPDWVQEYLEMRCLPATPRLRRILQFLFSQVLGLLHERDLISPQDVLSAHEVFDGNSPEQMRWNVENDLAALVVLLTLPRVSRTVDGLKLIAQRADFSNLFLPYGKSFCVTLDEWRFLISTLSPISQLSTETHNDAVRHQDAILEKILNHICLTLSPEEVIQVLPDDGDLELYLSTIEVSLQLDQVREKQDDSRMANAVAG